VRRRHDDQETVMTRISRRKFFEESAAIAGAGLLGRLAGPLSVPLLAAPALPRRRFGKTGVQVSMVGLGGGGRFFEPVESDEAGAELVRQAIERGVDFIETSANYGPREDPDRSERRIGMAMKTHRARAFIETKIDARDYDGAMREMERSLKLFNTDHIDLVLHHAFFDVKEVDRVLQNDGAERAIRKMVEQKAVRFHGFSCHLPALTLNAIPRIEPDAIQLPLNATRVPDFEVEVLPLTSSKTIAVIAMKTVGHGFFRKEAIGGVFDSRSKTDKNPAEHRFSPPEEAFTGPHPMPDDFVRYALSLPIATAVIGTDSVATLDAYTRVARTFKPLTVAERNSIHERAQVFATTGYWIPRQRTTRPVAD
jgi:aryl-alcohol dehydrogenase-like predicted oxidoreductase